MISNDNTNFEYTPTINTMGYYKFNGNGLDSSGNNNNLTLIGSPTGLTYVNSKFDRCCDFLGTSHLSGNYNFGLTGDFTISFWIKDIDIVDPHEISSNLLSLSNNIRYGDTQIWYTINDYAGLYSVIAYVGISPQQPSKQLISLPFNNTIWNNIIYTRGDSKIDLYLNGNLCASTGWTYTQSDASWVIVGGFLDEVDQHAKCKLDELIFENKYWTQDMINQYYKPNSIICDSNFKILLD